MYVHVVTVIECIYMYTVGAEVNPQKSNLPPSLPPSLPPPHRNLTSTEQQALKMEEGSSGACLIAVARLQHFGDGSPRTTMEASENEFVARVGTDGRYTYVDPRVVGVLGYLPQDLIGQVSYEYYHPEDIQKMVQLQHDGETYRMVASQ